MGVSFFPAPDAEAAKTRNCATNASPKGVEVYSAGSEVWVANDGGSLQKFSTTTCTGPTTYTVTGDPHFIDRQTSTKIAFTQHIGDKISFYDPSTGTQTDCSSVNVDGPDDIDAWDTTYEYATSYNAGKVLRINKSLCAITSYTVPGTNPNPEGIDKSTDISGFFVIDQNNNKLYKFTVSDGSFTLCKDFNTITGAPKPWFVAASDSQDILWVTFNAEQKVRALGTLSCLVAETSGTAAGNPYDIAIAGGNVDPYVTFNNNAKVQRYKTSTHTWSTADDWSTECGVGCTGFGIDTDIASNTYYAAMRSGGSTHKLVVGSIAG
jgi:hypothetical protein